VEDVFMKNKRGFTLMELLIVIAIIGILVSVSVASYSSAQKKGRDARRHTDLKAVQNAWEQYYADNNASYPSDPGCAYSANPTPGVQMGPIYLPGGLPVDPKSGVVPTPYQASCTSTTYCFCAKLEGETNIKPDCAGNLAPTGYPGLDCARNLQ
jgi:prepilin-type N-terminal cleavage/methylation domain-containing protein